MLLTVERTSYFQSPRGGSLSFTEESPPPAEPRHEHQVCNCTREVTARPAGEPEHVSQNIIVTSSLSDKWLHVDCRPGMMAFSFSWNQPETGLPPHGCHFAERPSAAQENHLAYFWIHPGRSRHPHIDITITRKGCGLTDCFFGHLYVGNDIGTSQMRNGWLPSLLFARTKVLATDVWCYDEFCGKEAIDVFAAGKEADFWRDLLSVASTTMAKVEPVLADHTSPVDAVRAQAESLPLLDFVGLATPRLNDVIATLGETEMFSRCDGVRRKVYPARTERSELIQRWVPPARR